MINKFLARIFARREWLLLFLLITFFVGLSAFWTGKHAVPPRWDEAAYLENSEIFYKSLVDDGPFALVRQFAIISPSKAPLISAIPVPLYLIFGRGERTALIANFILLALFYVFLFLLTKRLFNRVTALLAVFVASTMPYLFGIYRVFLVEGGLTAIVTAFLYFLLKSDNFRIKKYNCLLGVLLGFGLLMKITFPVFIAGPVLLVVWPRVRQEGFGSRSLRKNILLVLLIGGLIASVWYARNLIFVLGWILIAGFSGQVAGNYGLGEIFSLKTILNYWTNIINFNISFFYFALFLVIFVGLLIVRRGEWRAIFKNNLFRIFFLVSWFLIPLVIFTFGVNKDIRFMLPAMPTFAMGLAVLIGKLFSQRWQQLVFIPLLFVFPLFNFFYSSFNLKSLGSLAEEKFVDFGPFIVLRKNLSVVHPPVAEYWPQKEILSFIANDIKRFPFNVNAMMITDHPYFNLNNFRYYNRLYDFETINVHTNAYFPREMTMDEVAKKLNSQDYLIGKTGDQGPEFTTYRNAEIQEMLGEGQLPFNKIQEFDLPDGSEAMLYKNKNLM